MRREKIMHDEGTFIHQNFTSICSTVSYIGMKMLWIIFQYKNQSLSLLSILAYTSERKDKSESKTWVAAEILHV